MAYNYKVIANELNAEEFELLLRAYIEKQLSDNHVKPDYVSLYYNNSGKVTCKWNVTVKQTDTKGELLAMCAFEANRRQAADKANSLLLLEHTE